METDQQPPAPAIDMKPPLPEPHSTVDIWGHDVNLYTASKVREYADTCTAALVARVAELEADAKRLREALEAIVRSAELHQSAVSTFLLIDARAAIDAAMKETK